MWETSLIKTQKQVGEKVRIMWRFKSLSNCKGYAEAMVNISLECDGNKRKTLSNINQPDRFYSPTHRQAWRWTGGWAKLHFVSFHPEAPCARLVREIRSSTQARLTVPKPNCGPELPLPHPGTQETPERPADWQLPSNMSLFSSGRSWELWYCIAAPFGGPKGEIRFLTHYQK